jgi:phosphate transport system ATP-binding protein
MSKIETYNLNLYYGIHHALKGIDFAAEKNTVTALIGPSGCGKSTFLRCFNRMNDLIDDCEVTGRILIDGNNINEKGMDVNALRKKVGMVFQKPNPFPKSIFDNVAYGLKIKGITDKTEVEQRVHKALNQAAIWNEVKDNLKKNALSLSGGQQQRLCIARALAVEPSLVLMDEPTSALDPLSTAKVEELIADLKKLYTIIIVTHNMQQARRVSDKTAFFYLGEIVEYDSTTTIFENPKQERTNNYISGKFG